MAHLYWKRLLQTIPCLLSSFGLSFLFQLNNHLTDETFALSNHIVTVQTSTKLRFLFSQFSLFGLAVLLLVRLVF